MRLLTISLVICKFLRSNASGGKMSGFNNNTEAVAKREIVATISTKAEASSKETARIGARGETKQRLAAMPLLVQT